MATNSATASSRRSDFSHTSDFGVWCHSEMYAPASNDRPPSPSAAFCLRPRRPPPSNAIRSRLSAGDVESHDDSSQRLPERSRDAELAGIRSERVRRARWIRRNVRREWSAHVRNRAPRNHRSRQRCMRRGSDRNDDGRGGWSADRRAHRRKHDRAEQLDHASRHRRRHGAVDDLVESRQSAQSDVRRRVAGCRLHRFALGRRHGDGASGLLLRRRGIAKPRHQRHGLDAATATGLRAALLRWNVFADVHELRAQAGVLLQSRRRLRLLDSSPCNVPDASATWRS